MVNYIMRSNDPNKTQVDWTKLKYDNSKYDVIRWKELPYIDLIIGKCYRIYKTKPDNIVEESDMILVKINTDDKYLVFIEFNELVELDKIKESFCFKITNNKTETIYEPGISITIIPLEKIINKNYIIKEMTVK